MQMSLYLVITSAHPLFPLFQLKRDFFFLLFYWLPTLYISLVRRSISLLLPLVYDQQPFSNFLHHFPQVSGFAPDGFFLSSFPMSWQLILLKLLP